MSPRIVYLFPDTNLFVQCLPLQQLDWNLLGSFDEIELMVSRPVQREIDKHKNVGRGRINDRARATSSIFRDMIVNSNGQKLINQATPVVNLSIRHEIKPSALLVDRLDYEQPDDELVGIAYAFRQENPDADVRVLTHDTGPMASAEMVKMAFIPIPDQWVLPPESAESERRIGALQSEIARLRAGEPALSVEFLDQIGKKADKLEIEVVRYEALTDSDVSQLMSVIKGKFPLASDFGAQESSRRMGSKLSFSMPEVFVPATEQEIASYREDHDNWLGKCEKKLRSFHDILQRREGVPNFTFVGVNDGARPGKDVLVDLVAKGEFMIMPPPYRSEPEEPMESISLPKPPSVPRGTWKTESVWEQYSGLMRGLGGIREAVRAQIVPEEFSLGDLRAPRHDPNAFYYKPPRPSSPTSKFQLVCEQWRHGVEPELFTGEIHINKKEGNVSGVLECWIHAENLSNPVVKRVPVRIRIKNSKATEFARNKVDFLVAGIAL
jgi:hypothetical protein